MIELLRFCGKLKDIDHFDNGGQVKYFFVLMLISPSRLAQVSTIQKNFGFKMRPVGLITIDTKK